MNKVSGVLQHRRRRDFLSMGDNWKMGSGPTCWCKPGKRKASWMEQQGQKSNHLWTLEASSCSHLSNRQNGIKSCSRVRIWFIMSKQTSKKKNSMMDIIIIRSAGLVELEKSYAEFISMMIIQAPEWQRSFQAYSQDGVRLFFSSFLVPTGLFPSYPVGMQRSQNGLMWPPLIF